MYMFLSNIFAKKTYVGFVSLVATLALLSGVSFLYAQEDATPSDSAETETVVESASETSTENQPTAIEEDTTFGTRTETAEEETEDVSTRKVRYPERALKTLDAFDYSISRLQNLSGRLSNKLNELETEGEDVGSLRRDMQSVNSLIRNAFGGLKKIKHTTKQALSTGVYADGFVEQSRSELETIKKSGLAAQEAMIAVVLKMEGQEVPAVATTPQVVPTPSQDSSSSNNSFNLFGDNGSSADSNPVSNLIPQVIQ